MNFASVVSAAILAVGIGSAAIADQVKASEPESVLGYFEDLGAPAKLVEDSVGDPSVEVQYYGTSMVVFFYGCRDNSNCNSLQFFAGYTEDSEISLEGLNSWNAEQRYGRAYRAEDGRKLLEYDVYTGQDGVSMDDFDEIFDIWTEVVESFEDALS